MNSVIPWFATTITDIIYTEFPWVSSWQGHLLWTAAPLLIKWDWSMMAICLLNLSVNRFLCYGMFFTISLVLLCWSCSTSKAWQTIKDSIMFSMVGCMYALLSCHGNRTQLLINNIISEKLCPTSLSLPSFTSLV